MNGDKTAIRAALEEGRRRTWELADGIRDDDLRTPAAPYLSPPVWDLGHMANFEELWLVQRLADRPELHPGDNDTYDAFAHPRPERPQLNLLDRAGARCYHDEVRAWTLRVLDGVDTSAHAHRLTRDGFVHWMIVLHEHQHQETLMQSIQMRAARYTPPTVRPLPAPQAPAQGWCDVPAGPFTMGREQGPGVYDNEAPAHEVDVDAFAIARCPVTNREHLAFMEAGGYDDPHLWSRDGRAWLKQEPHHAPLYWYEKEGRWWRRTVRDDVPIASVPDEILCHVTAYEAEAHAAWRAQDEDGVRLPTEAEWEKAARWTQGRPASPAGDQANIDHYAWGPSRAGAYAAAPCGARHMLGDVWEWTSTEFAAYPGFEAFPYKEYSEVFFDSGLRVLRGGSWATRAPCATATFRNWDLPVRRQIFAGIRLAKGI